MQLHNGDCLEVMQGMDSGSIDSIVTDPPAGIAFMGKGWDSDKGGRDSWIGWMSVVMQECRRVLKPGGHALVWALPRTSHWTATACENAGFEIRDVIHHLFGSGFPKSLDISKAIDKAAGADREVIPKILGGAASGALKLHGCKNEAELIELAAINAKTPDGRSAAKTLARYQDTNAISDTPATPEAAKWAGFGTACKPAAEHWILCRKPLIGTVAANVLEYGTGGLNIDAGRVESGTLAPRNAPKANIKGGRWADRDSTDKSMSHYNPTQGRFPSNLILTHSAACAESCAPDCPCGEIDKAQFSGVSKGGVINISAQNKVYGANVPHTTIQPPSNGRPSSYFKIFHYHPKISADDRELYNNHPTVKATDLMRYLIALITPPKGIVLDCFMGSGSTGKAAVIDGFDFVGIEQDPDYFKIAQARIHRAGAEPSLF